MFGSKDKKRILYYGLKGKGPWELANSPRIIHPFPEDSPNWEKKRIDRDFAVKPDDWKKLSIESKDEIFKDAVLSSEVETRRTPAFVYFRRSFAQIPADHSEYNTTTYKYPDYRSTFFDFADTLLRVGPTRTTVLRVSYTYQLTTTPETAFTLETAFQPLEGIYEREFLVASGTTPTLTAYLTLVTNKSFIRAEDDVFERWHGNIWRRVRKEVMAQ